MMMPLDFDCRMVEMAPDMKAMCTVAHRLVEERDGYAEVRTRYGYLNQFLIVFYIALDKTLIMKYVLFIIYKLIYHLTSNKVPLCTIMLR